MKCKLCGKFIGKNRYERGTCDFRCDAMECMNHGDEEPIKDDFALQRAEVSERTNPCQGMSVASDELHKIHPFGKY